MLLYLNRDAIVLQGWYDVIRKQTDAYSFSLVAIFLRSASEDTSLQYYCVTNDAQSAE